MKPYKVDVNSEAWRELQAKVKSLEVVTPEDIATVLIPVETLLTQKVKNSYGGQG